jgi:hypothetical protein
MHRGPKTNKLRRDPTPTSPLQACKRARSEADKREKEQQVCTKGNSVALSGRSKLLGGLLNYQVHSNENKAFRIISVRPGDWDRPHFSRKRYYPPIELHYSTKGSGKPQELAINLPTRLQAKRCPDTRILPRASERLRFWSALSRAANLLI